jgi:adenylosuccinate synthase
MLHTLNARKAKKRDHFMGPWQKIRTCPHVKICPRIRTRKRKEKNKKKADLIGCAQRGVMGTERTRARRESEHCEQLTDVLNRHLAAFRRLENSVYHELYFCSTKIEFFVVEAIELVVPND